MDVIQKMNEIGKDIVHFEDKEAAKKAINELLDQFYTIIRKHGIKWGTGNERSTTGANFEWTLVKDAFLYRITSLMEWEMFMNIPEDLKRYYKETQDEDVSEAKDESK